MKKKTTHQLDTFKMIHLYRDDLEKIEHLLKKELNAKSFTVSTSGYEYGTFSEIQSDTAPTNDLVIQTSQPYVSITLEKSGARLYFAENSLAEEGAFSEISTILKDRQRVFVHNSTRLWLWPIIWFLPLAVELVLPKKDIQSNWFAAFLITYGMIVIILVIFAARARLSHYSIVDFVKKSARPGFFVRNKDQIALNLLFTIFGALLGFWLSKAF